VVGVVKVAGWFVAVVVDMVGVSVDEESVGAGVPGIVVVAVGVPSKNEYEYSSILGLAM
jgi:hypothetical protein